MYSEVVGKLFSFASGLSCLLLVFGISCANNCASADDASIKARYFRLYMEYQNVEIHGTVDYKDNLKEISHNFILRMGESRDGKIPPLEIVVLAPNPGEPHLNDEFLVDTAYVVTDDFLNIQFTREYISQHREKFGLSPEGKREFEKFKEQSSKSLRFSALSLRDGPVMGHEYFYAILQSIEMGLDGYSVRQYWGNEARLEKGSKFEVVGNTTSLDYPCSRVRYTDISGTVIDALVATEPTMQIVQVIDVPIVPPGFNEDNKTIWLNLPKTESIKRFGKWLIRDRVSYKGLRTSWEVRIEDVKPLAKGYQGLWDTYDTLTGCTVMGPAEPRTRKGTARVALEGSEGVMYVPFSDEEMSAIIEYLPKPGEPTPQPKTSITRVLIVAVGFIAVVVVIILRYRRLKR